MIRSMQGGATWWVCLLGSVSLLCGASVRAQPYVFTRQHFGQQITFGDSLSDAGNSYALAGVPPLGPPPPTGSDQGRYSNGPMYPELLAPSFSLSAPGLLGGAIAPASAIDFAVGGSLSGNEPFDPATASSPGAITQVQEYLGFVAKGTVAPVAPSTIYTIFTGGNDYTGYMASLATSPYPSLASMQAETGMVQGNIATAIKLLAARGAKTIAVMDQFDIGLVPVIHDPAAYGLPPGTLPSYAAALGTQLSDIHNASLPSLLTQLQAQTGVRLIEIDVNALYRDAFFNPSVYGLTNVTSSCVGLDFATAPPNAPSCATVSQASHVMFWQATHPGFTIQTLIAELVNGTLQTVLTGPQTIAVQSRLGLIAEQGLWSVAQRQTRAPVSPGLQLFLDNGYGTGRRDATSGRTGYDYNRYGLSVGGAYGFSSHIFVGAYLGYNRGNASLSAGAGALGLDSYGVSAFAGLQRHGWWGLAQIDGLYDGFSTISRSSGLSYFPEARASTRGWTDGFGIEAGRAWNIAGLKIGPYGGYHITDVAIRGYNETGTRLLNLAVANHGVTSAKGIFGVRVDGQATVAGVDVLPMADIAYAHDFSSGVEVISTALADGQTASAFSATRAQDIATLNLGFRLAVSRVLNADISFGQTLIRSGGTDRRVQLQLSYRF